MVITGNRCGHSKDNPRLCDIVRRGKKGHPPVIGRIVSALGRAYYDRSLLTTWQSSNPSGRRKRSEKRESAISLAQYLFTQWFSLDTRRCAVSGGYFLQVPDANHLARKITEKGWNGERLSKGRIDDVFCEWNKAGYITSRQKRELRDDGKWEASPAIRTFTKKFFLELGGRRLWDAVRKAGVKKLDKIVKSAKDAGMSLQEYLSPSWIVSPKIVRKLRLKSLGANKKATSNEKIRESKIRESKEYNDYYTQKLFELFAAKGEDKWSPEECSDNAKRITDKHFNITSYRH